MFKKKKDKSEEADLQTQESVKDAEDLESFEVLDAMEGTAGKKKKLPSWAIIPVIGVLVIIGVAGYLASGHKSEKSSQIDTVKAKKEDIKQVYNTNGTVGSEKEKVFYSPVNAPIDQCNIKAGQAVKAGDMMVTFDTTNSAKYSSQDAIEQSGRAAQTQAQTQAQTEAGIKSLKDQIQQKQAEIDSLTQAAQSAGSAAAANAQKAAELKGEMHAP